MIFTTTLLKRILILNYCLLIQTVLKYEIKSENVYEDFFKWKDLIDFSNYSKDSKFLDDGNKHKTGTYEYDKISLSCFDDKCFVLDDGVYTLTYFHKDYNKKNYNDKKPVIIEKD